MTKSFETRETVLFKENEMLRVELIALRLVAKEATEYIITHKGAGYYHLKDALTAWKKLTSPEAK